MIKLERFTLDEIPRLMSWLPSEAELVQWSGHFFQWPLLQAEFESHYQATLKPNPNCFAFRAVRLSDSAVVGHLELDLIDLPNRYASLARVLVKPGERSKGIGSVMTDLLVRLAFTKMPLQTIGLNVVSFNQAAISCYRRIGFQLSARGTGRYQIGEKSWEVNQMMLQQQDWRRLNEIISS